VESWKAGRSSGITEYRQHHIMWVIPNYRTDEGATEFEPLTADQEFNLAFDDSFDPTDQPKSKKSALTAKDLRRLRGNPFLTTRLAKACESLKSRNLPLPRLSVSRAEISLYFLTQLRYGFFPSSRANREYRYFAALLRRSTSPRSTRSKMEELAHW
jgi:hypothetical protein